MPTKGFPVGSTTRVIVLVSSLRKEALNRKMAQALIALDAPPRNFEFAENGNLPLYNEDLQRENPPAVWLSFREQGKNSEAVPFVTSKDERSIPGALKNAIDVASRPYRRNSFAGKPGAVISVSPAARGTSGANHHLRQFLVFLNVPVMQQPEAYIGGAANLLGPEGNLTKQTSRDFLAMFAKSFANGIEANRQRG